MSDLINSVIRTYIKDFLAAMENDYHMDG